MRSNYSKKKNKFVLVLVSLLMVGIIFPGFSAQAEEPDPNQAEPSETMPEEAPPAPPANPPTVTQPSAAAPTTQPLGQWIYTQQYGWVWMPYDQKYTHVVDEASLAYAYVWYPTFGWRWVSAPWVLGYGVSPYWGTFGVQRYAWYSRPWFRVGRARRYVNWGHPHGWGSHGLGGRGWGGHGWGGRGFGGGHRR